MMHRNYVSTELPKEHADKFRMYLKDNGIHYEPSECGNLIHFQCLMTEGEVIEANSYIDMITQ